MEQKKYPIPFDARISKCKGTTCGQDIWWFKLPSGKWMCADGDGTPHFATCPNRKDFRKGRNQAK